jgi:hypothetical protein
MSVGPVSYAFSKTGVCGQDLTIDRKFNQFASSRTEYEYFQQHRGPRNTKGLRPNRVGRRRRAFLGYRLKDHEILEGTRIVGLWTLLCLLSPKVPSPKSEEVAPRRALLKRIVDHRI